MNGVKDSPELLRLSSSRLPTPSISFLFPSHLIITRLSKRGQISNHLHFISILLVNMSCTVSYSSHPRCAPCKNGTWAVLPWPHCLSVIHELTMLKRLQPDRRRFPFHVQNAKLHSICSASICTGSSHPIYIEREW